MVTIVGLGCGGAPLERFEYRERHMGSEARIVLYAARAGLAERAARAAFARIAELDSLLSDYREDSEVTRLAHGAGGPPLPVSPDLLAVLRAARSLAVETGGAFDVTVGPLAVLWRDAARAGRLPDTADLGAARALVDWRKLEIDTAAGTVRLAGPGMRLDLGGIGKGYAADQALGVLGHHGADRALVAIGGEIVAGRRPPEGPGWRIAVEHAEPGHDTVLIESAAISSSGDAERFVEVGGVRYSHVVDPRTGLGLTHRAAATVVAPNGITADALATAVTLLDGARRTAFIAAHPEARFYVLGGPSPSRP
jgi:FAD:protein FMN transferase